VVSEADKKAEERIKRLHTKAISPSLGGRRGRWWIYLWRGGLVYRPPGWHKELFVWFSHVWCVGGFGVGRKPVVGAVYLPYFNSLYYAGEGLGAYKDGKRIQVSTREEMRRMSVSYGFPSRAKRDLNLYWKVFKEVFEKVGL
jgi:myo-inositol-1(or 4)-monophosphatase